MPPAAPPPRQWAPSCFLVLHGPRTHCSLRYCPMHLQRAADASYRSEIKIYGRSAVKSIWSAESGPMNLEDAFSIESGQIAADLGVDQLFHYGECYNWSPEMPPPTPNVAMPLHLHYGSSDGSLHGHLASFFIFGAPRQLQRGERYYESFPAARINAEHTFSAFLINPFVRASKYRIQVLDGEHGVWKSEEFSVRGKGVAEWNSTGSGFPGSDRPVGVVVESELKTTSFFATRAADGRMIGLDHGHPFLAQVLAN